MVLGKQTGILKLTCGAFGGPIGHLSTRLSRGGETVNHRSRVADKHAIGAVPIILPGPRDVQAYRLPAEADGRRTDLSVVGAGVEPDCEI